MKEGIRRLRDAVVRPDREVEVDPNGRVHEIPRSPSPREQTPLKDKPTKLAPRTFGTNTSDTARRSVTESLRAAAAFHTAIGSVDSLRVVRPVEDFEGRLLLISADAAIRPPGSPLGVANY